MRNTVATSAIFLSILLISGIQCRSARAAYAYFENPDYSSWDNAMAWDPDLTGTVYSSVTITVDGTDYTIPDCYEDSASSLNVDDARTGIDAAQTLGLSFNVDYIDLESSAFSQLTAGDTPRWIALATSGTAIKLGSSAGSSFTLGGIDSPMYLLLEDVPSIDVEGTTSGTQRTLTINASIFGTGFYKTGGGILKLTNDDNLYTGGTEIDAGTLAISDDGDLGDTSGTLYLNGGTLRSDATFSLSSSRGVDLTGGGYINTNGYHLTIPGTISDDGPLIKQGTGTLTISGNKSGAGEIEVSGGTLEVSSTMNGTGT